jgi:hypothetical protein
MPADPKYRAAKWCQAVPGAVSREQGHKRTLEVCLTLVHGFLLDDAALWEVLRDWNAKCEPPWSDRELQHKVKSAQNIPGPYGKNRDQQPGWKLLEGHEHEPEHSATQSHARAASARNTATPREYVIKPPDEVNQKVRLEVAMREGWDVDALTRLSGEIPQDAESAIDALFPHQQVADQPHADHLLCVGKDKWNFKTVPREKWRGHLHRMQFIVANPMSTRMGLTVTGEWSYRTKNNTGPRRYLVFECDLQTPEEAAAKAAGKKGKTREQDAPATMAQKAREQDAPATMTADELRRATRCALDGDLLALALERGKSRKDVQAAFLMELRRHAPLVMVVDSGGKSLHGWFDAKHASERAIRSFISVAVRLGADPLTFNACWLVRLPWGLRDGNPNKQQKVLYFNESAISQ